VGATAAFWIAIAAGRRVSSRVISAALPARRVLTATLLLATAALAVAAATGGLPRATALLVALVAVGPVYPLVLATAPGAGDARVLAVVIAAGALGGTLVTGLGALAYRWAGLPGVLVLAAGMIAVCLVAGDPRGSGRSVPSA
jgi:fucose permease